MKFSVLFIIMLVVAGLAIIALRTRVRTRTDNRVHALQIKGTFLSSKCDENLVIDWNDVRCWEFSNNDGIDPGVVDLIIVAEILLSLLILFFIYTYCIKIFSPNENGNQGTIFTVPVKKFAETELEDERYKNFKQTGDRSTYDPESPDTDSPPAYGEIDKPPAYMLVNTFDI